MSKVKMRCIACGKWFQSANAKEVTCPDCVQKARKEKMAAKNAPPPVSRFTGPGNVNSSRPGPPPPKPKPAQPGGTNQWLDSLHDVKVGQPDQPPVRPKLPPSPAQRDQRSGPDTYRGPGGYRDRESGGSGPDTYRGPGGYREGGNRGPGGYRDERGRGPGAYRELDQRGPVPFRPSGSPGQSSFGGPRMRPPTEGSFGRGPRPGGPRDGNIHKGPGGQRPRPKSNKPAVSRPAAPPKPKKEKIPPPPPFVPTPEQINQVEVRYLELAQPAEFDGIRTQISRELSIPKKAVKKIIKDLRSRQSIPSWWEIQTYKGSSEEMERIKALYLPMLPVPIIGVHKKIAEDLSLKPGDVYQAIKAIRLEMNLPQYNDPVSHGEEFAVLAQRRNKQKETTEGQEGQTETQAEVSPASAESGEPVAIAATITATPSASDAAATSSLSETSETSSSPTSTDPVSNSESEQQ